MSLETNKCVSKLLNFSFLRKHLLFCSSAMHFVTISCPFVNIKQRVTWINMTYNYKTCLKGSLCNIVAFIWVYICLINPLYWYTSWYNWLSCNLYSVNIDILKWTKSSCSFTFVLTEQCQLVIFFYSSNTQGYCVAKQYVTQLLFSIHSKLHQFCGASFLLHFEFGLQIFTLIEVVSW